MQVFYSSKLLICLPGTRKQSLAHKWEGRKCLGLGRTKNHKHLLRTHFMFPFNPHHLTTAVLVDGETEAPSDVSCPQAHRWAGVAEQDFEPGVLAQESYPPVCCRAVGVSFTWGPGLLDWVLHARCMGQGPGAQVSAR